jgi:hypothetical protein
MSYGEKFADDARRRLARIADSLAGWGKSLRAADNLADAIAVLCVLDRWVADLRGLLGLRKPGESITWFCGASGEREYEVFADGYGRFRLLEYEGMNPHDLIVHHEAEYADEAAACAAARRLGEGVAWEDRDKPAEGEDDD